jgi:phage terminase large subunit-like protein
VRYWDLAATEKTEFNDPDWTVSIELGRDKDGGYSLLDMARGRANPGDTERLRSILPRRTARAFASASARIQGRPAKPRRTTSCARSVASPLRRLRGAGTS